MDSDGAAVVEQRTTSPSTQSFPLALNQSMAPRMLSRMGVWGMPSSSTALDEFQKEYWLPTRTQAAVVTGGLRVSIASSW